jgi:hypothetical protein
MELTFKDENDLKYRKKINDNWRKLAVDTIYLNSLWRKHNHKKSTFEKVICFFKNCF